MHAVRHRLSDPTDPTAVVVRRFDAWCIDLLLYLVVMFVLLIPLGGEERFFFHADKSGSPVANSSCAEWSQHHTGFCVTQAIVDDIPGNGTTQITIIDFGLTTFLLLVVPMLAYALFQGLMGGSPGKLALGLRVVKPDGSPAGVWRSVARTLMWVFDAIFFGLPVVGAVFLLTTKRHQRLGDLTASTFVVDRGDVGQPIVAPTGSGSTP